MGRRAGGLWAQMAKRGRLIGGRRAGYAARLSARYRGSGMSWDLFVFSAETAMGAGPAGEAVFADDFQPMPIGPLRQVRSDLSAVFPAIDWTEPGWGSLDAEGYSLEFSLGAEDPCLTLMIHARGAATPAILKLIDATGWHVLDMSSGKWINLSSDPDAGRQLFEAYLQSVLPSPPPPQSPPEPPVKRGVLSRLFGR